MSSNWQGLPHPVTTSAVRVSWMARLIDWAVVASWRVLGWPELRSPVLEGDGGTWFSDRRAGPTSWDDAFMADELGGPQPPAMLGNLTFLLAMAGGSARVRVEEVLSAFGIGMRGLGILAHIAAEPDLSYSALARRSNVTVQTMTASIKALQTSGHIAPRDPTQAGRAARLLLTPHGRQTLAAADQSIAAMSDGWLPLDADERQTLASLLGKVVRATVERAT